MSKTKDKDFRDGDGEDVSEALFETTVDHADAYLNRFERLQDRAYRHGYSTMLIISWHDPLSGYSASRSISKGNHYQNMGAARRVLTQKENE